MSFNAIFRHSVSGIVHGVVSIPKAFAPAKPGRVVLGAHLMDWHGELYEVVSETPVRLKNLTTGREFASEVGIVRRLFCFVTDEEKIMLYGSFTKQAQIGMQFMNGADIYTIVAFHDTLPIMAFSDNANGKLYCATTRILSFYIHW